MIKKEQGANPAATSPIYADEVKPNNSRTNFVDDIPDNVGPKSMPLWLKSLFVFILGGGLVGGAYFYYLQKESGLNDSVSAFIGAESAETPIIEPEVTLALSAAENDVRNQDFDNSRPLVDSVVQSYSTPIIGGDSEINLLDVNEPPKIDNLKSEAAVTIRGYDDNSIQQEDPAIESTVKSMPQKIAPETVKPEIDTAKAIEKASTVAVKEALEKYSDNQIIIVKTSLELQGQAKAKLEGLLKSLDSLLMQVQIQEEEEETAVKLSASHSKSKRNIPTAATKTAITAKTKPIKPSTPPNIKLFGVDLWAGERFAQIEYNKELQLVALNESVGEWRVIDIASTKVTLKNKHGDLIELTSE